MLSISIHTTTISNQTHARHDAFALILRHFHPTYKYNKKNLPRNDAGYKYENQTE